jgi:hypothetical protein
MRTVAGTGLNDFELLRPKSEFEDPFVTLLFSYAL